MSDYEPLILAALNHQWQTTKEIAANIPCRMINEHSMVATCWGYLDRMKKARIVEQ